MGYPFGKDIEYTIYPLSDDVPVSGIPAQTTTLYLYDYRPSRADALTGAGSLASDTAAWALNATSGTFTIPAITEPSENESNNNELAYWVVVLLALQTGAPIQPIYRTLPLQRVQGVHQTLAITSADLEAVYGPVTKMSTLAKRDSAILDAVDIVKSKLRDEGYKWAQIYRIDRVQSAVKYRALATLMLSELQEEGGKYKFLYDTFLKDFETHLERLVLEYDSFNTGEPDVIAQEGRYVFAIR